MPTTLYDEVKSITIQSGTAGLKNYYLLVEIAIISFGQRVKKYLHKN